MPSSLFSATCHAAKAEGIAATTSVGSLSVVVQVDGTVWVPTADAAQVTANTYTLPARQDGQTEEEFLALNGDAILAALAAIQDGTLDAVIYPRYAADLIMCKKIPGWVQDAPAA